VAQRVVLHCCYVLARVHHVGSPTPQHPAKVEQLVGFEVRGREEEGGGKGGGEEGEEERDHVRRRKACQCGSGTIAPVMPVWVT
jgi:hypothetical protein